MHGFICDCWAILHDGRSGMTMLYVQRLAYALGRVQIETFAYQSKDCTVVLLFASHKISSPDFNNPFPG